MSPSPAMSSAQCPAKTLGAYVSAFLVLCAVSTRAQPSLSPGDVLTLDASTHQVFRVPAAGTVDVINVPPAIIAIATARDGLVYGLSADGLRIHALDPKTTDEPTEIVLTQSLGVPLDIAVAESGRLAVLDGNHAAAGTMVLLVDPETGSVEALAGAGGPPTNHLGVGGATPMGIAFAPGGDLIVAQTCGAHYQIVRIGPSGEQTLFEFLMPALPAASHLAIDALPAGQAVLAASTGDVVLFTFATNQAQRIGSAPAPAAQVDVAVAGVRHAFLACDGLFELRWNVAADTLVCQAVPGVPGEITSVAIHRGPAAPGAVLASESFNSVEQFERDVLVNTYNGSGSAALLTVSGGSLLHMLSGVSGTSGFAPVGIVTELQIPARAVHLHCRYRFSNVQSAMDVFINQRFACRIAVPPAQQPGSPTSNVLADLSRQINLERLGLLGAPRLVAEIVLKRIGTGALPAAEAYLDDLGFDSSDCGMLFGDLNLDACVDLCDAQALTAQYGTSDECFDLNQDGYVDALDFASLLAIASRDYLGPDCWPPGASTFVGASRNDPTAPAPGNVLILAKDADWFDWIYEVHVDPQTSVATCVGRFRTPEPSGSRGCYTYTQLRHDGHGTLYTVDFQGRIERWSSQGDVLACAQPLAAGLEAHGQEWAGLGPVDIAVLRGAGAWVSFSPSATDYTVRDESCLVHFGEDCAWQQAWLNPAYKRARTLLATAPDAVWALSASQDAGDLLLNLLGIPVESHLISGLAAVICTDPTRDRDRLHIGSAAADQLNAYALAGGVGSVSGPPLAVYMLPDCTAVTGAMQDAGSGDLYVCGFRACTSPAPAHMEPRLTRIPASGGPPIAVDLTGVCPELCMPLSITVYQPAPAGDFDADFDIDLLDFGQLQRCAGEGSDWCLEDYDFDQDADVDALDFALYEAVYGGPND